MQPYRLLGPRRRIIGTTLRARPAWQKAEAVAGVRRDLWEHVAAGRIRPIVHEVLPLAEAGAAQRLLEDGESIGKVVLTVDEG